MIEIPLSVVVFIAGLFALMGVGVGLFAGMFLLHRPQGSYDGQVYQRNVAAGPLVAGEGQTPTFLTIGFKNRYHGRMTFQFEGDAEAREILRGADVGDKWRIDFTRLKRAEHRHVVPVSSIGALPLEGEPPPGPIGPVGGGN